MSGNPSILWLALVLGMLLQLTYMILPFQRWDWARFLAAALLPLLILAKGDNDHTPVNASDGLLLCGMFTFAFAIAFQSRLLPRLAEGAILMWTAVLLCVVIELGAWHSAAAYLALGAGVTVLALLIAQHTLAYILKLAVYAWFLLAVVMMGVLQFHSADFSLIADGGARYLDYRLAVIDGAAGAYIGVHAAFLLEMLPIPTKGESLTECKKRWTGYLAQVASRLDDQRLTARMAVLLVLGIAMLAYVNHEVGLLPDRTLLNLVLFGLPIVWRAASYVHQQRAGTPAPVAPAMPPMAANPNARAGIGRAGHSRKHRQ